MKIIYPSICLKYSYVYVPVLVFKHFAHCPTKHANFHAVQYFLQFGYTEYNFKEPLVGSDHLTQLVQGLDFVTGPKFCHFTLISLWMFVIVCSLCMLCAGFVETVSESGKSFDKVSESKTAADFIISQQENDLWERQ